MIMEELNAHRSVNMRLMLMLTYLCMVHTQDVTSVVWCPYAAADSVLAVNESGTILHTPQTAQLVYNCTLTLNGPPGRNIAFIGLSTAPNTGCQGQAEVNVNQGSQHCAANPGSAAQRDVVEFSLPVSLAISGNQPAASIQYYRLEDLCSSSELELDLADMFSLSGLLHTENISCGALLSSPDVNVTVKLEALSDSSQPNGAGNVGAASSVLINVSSIPLSITVERFNLPVQITSFYIKYSVLMCESSSLGLPDATYNAPQSPWLLGVRSTYQCTQGYRFRRGTVTITVTCQISGDQNALWSTPNDSCVPEAELCRDEIPPDMENALSVISPDNLATTYFCKEGYNTPDGSLTIFCLVDQNSWTWKSNTSRDTINCLPVSCPAPFTIEYGKVADTYLKTSYVFGDVISYECDDGYTLYRETMSCLASGTWSSTPLCVKSNDATGVIVLGVLFGLCLCILLAILVHTIFTRRTQITLRARNAMTALYNVRGRKKKLLVDNGEVAGEVAPEVTERPVSARSTNTEENYVNMAPSVIMINRGVTPPVSECEGEDYEVPIRSQGQNDEEHIYE